MTAISALFGNEEFNPLDIYTKSEDHILTSRRVGRYLGLALQHFKLDGKKEDSIVRIIEIGSGSGATAKEILNVLQNENIPYRYTFTDISPHFIESAKQQFSAIGGIEYKVLDIEKDPSSQGFCSQNYDVVVAVNVIHSTENSKKSLANIRKLICTGGIFVLGEMMKPCRALDVIFGTLDGYWKFNDYDIRFRHPLVSSQVWCKINQETGFDAAVNISLTEEITEVLVSKAVDIKYSHGIVKAQNLVRNINDSKEKPSAWIVFDAIGDYFVQIRKKFNHICDEVIFVQRENNQMEDATLNIFFWKVNDFHTMRSFKFTILQKYSIKGIIYMATTINNENQDIKYENFLTLCKFLSEEEHNNLQLVLVTKGVYYFQNQKLVLPFNAVVWGMAKSFANEVAKLQGKIIDLDPDEFNSEIESQQIFFEIFENEEHLVCYRSKKRFIARIIVLPKPLAPLTFPHGRYRIAIPKSKNINDIRFSALQKEPLGTKDIEILVKAVALNFRDIFNILKPEQYLTIKETVGSDFAGVVSNIGSEVTTYNIGDEVYGVAVCSAVGSHVNTHEDLCMRKPKEITFSEASTIPSVLLTAYYCLVLVADLKKGETILIHVASGGVGLVAIKIAQFIGAKIIVTAGSHRKRNYLRSLGIEHVFHSRDLTFGDEIEKVTQGRGVDIVLNSLTGHGFKEMTLQYCAQNARFVEMGKVNIWKSEEVTQLRPDVQYTIVDMEKQSETSIGYLIKEITNYFQDNEVYKMPLLHTRFDVVNIRDAFNYFLKAQHIGKVVVTMPDFIEVGNNIIKKNVVFNNYATYLITGGLGGIGLEVAKWMVDSGCKYLVLVARSLPNNIISQVLNSLRVKGCKIFTHQIDVGKFEECQSLFSILSSSENQFPPLKGVIHAAGVISDAIFMNQTWEKYQLVFNAKIAGCLNLHNLTKDLNLEHFILFSSMAGVFGPMGQSNHAAANAFLDSFARYRHSIGLPAQTINWGGWAEVGAASNTAYGKEGMFGIMPFTVGQGLASLKFIMSRPDLLQVGVIQIALNVFREYFSKGNLLSELDNEQEVFEISSSIQSETFWNEIRLLSKEDRNNYIKNKLTSMIKKTLKLPESETIDEFQSFQEMGLDSLMAVEMKNKLQNMLGKKVTLNVAAMLDHPTISSLSKFLTEQSIETEDGNDNLSQYSETIETVLDIECMLELAKNDSKLPQDICAQKEYSVPIDNMTKILLTGSTGHLGAYLLKELSQNKQFKIYCLIRGKSVKQARRKISNNMKKYDLFESFILDNIEILLGDVTEENLGIAVEDYNKYSTEIDMVVHLAAKVNHIESYKINIGNKFDIRSVNVLGTINVLKFAANIKTKRFLYSSSFSTINRFTEDGFIYEEFPDDDNNADGLTLGYTVSKFVCEKLLRQANERGIPCTVIRYSNLMGHSETGHFILDTNSTTNGLLLSLRFGVIANIEGCWFAFPVDIASKLMVEFICNNKLIYGVYNLVQPVPFYVSDYIAVVKELGFNLQIVSKDEFEDRLNKEAENNNFLEIFKDSQGGKLVYSEITKNHPKVRDFVESGANTNRISDKVKELIPDICDRIPHPHQIFHNHIAYAIQSGLYENFGIIPDK